MKPRTINYYFEGRTCSIELDKNGEVIRKPPRNKVQIELLLVYLIAFLLLLAILWYVSLTTGLVLQFTLNCNTYMVGSALHIKQ